MHDASSLRLLPCARCRYDLRGRVVGEQCPECGWIIDSPGPAWWDEALLRRMAVLGRVAAIPCWLLLAVPVHFVLALTDVLTGTGSSGLEWTFGIFVVLMSVQLLVQLVCVLLMADARLGPRRRRILRWAACVRAAAFGLAVLVLVIESVSPSEDLLMFAYFVLPLLAVGSDIATVRVFAHLAKEAQPILLERAAAQRTRARRHVVARAALWVVYPLLLIPIIGWFFAPIIWTMSMAVSFGALRWLARASLEARAET